MSDQIALSLQNVGKMYRMYPSRLAMAIEVTGVSRLFPWRKTRIPEFWALRNINLEVPRGERLGIIGRNGAGKSTMLKLLTGNLSPTEGQVNVNGTVQALLTSGAGFHPEFTGYENIRSSLVYQGVHPDQVESAVQDIVEFTELGDFLKQPFKLYSAGMQARLTFATATVLKPDILIVDEILGAGDAYFAGKSLERMKNLVENTGATVLIVSHSLDQILRYCNQCIWMERGRIVQRGPALEVVKAYEQFIHVLDERRLKAKNYKKNQSNQYNVDEMESLNNSLVMRFYWKGEIKSHCDISSVRLLKNNEVEDEILIGEAQDSNSAHSAFVVLDRGNWSISKYSGQRAFRCLDMHNLQPAQTSSFGDVVFYLYAVYEEATYAVEFEYNMAGLGTLLVEAWAWNKGTLLSSDEIPTSASWNKVVIPLKLLVAKSLNVVNEASSSHSSDQIIPSKPTKRRWPGKTGLLIEAVSLVGEDGSEKTVFNVGDRIFLRLRLKAIRRICLNLVLAATLYRLDGILISKFRSVPTKLDLNVDETKDFQMEMIGSVSLGNHNFVFSIGLFEDRVDDVSRLDLLDRSFEFRVVGNDDYYSQVIINLPGEWKML